MSCSKIPYWTAEQARYHAKRKLETTGFKLRAYCCPECGLYHLTSQSKAEARAHRRAARRIAAEMREARG